MKKIVALFKKETPFFFVCPALVWQVVFLYIPIAILFYTSLSLNNYLRLFAPFSLKILGNSFQLAFETTIITALLAYPIAYFIAFKAKNLRIFYLVLLILPSWTSLILQIYAWFFLLKRGGLFSQLFYWLGLTSQPLHMLNNHFAMLVGMVYCYLPFMALPIYAVLEKVDRDLIEASADLGASRWVTIKKVIFPLSLPGLIAGTFLVFIPSFGEFAIPELLGGSKQLFWGNIIVAKFLDYRDWPAGSAVTFVGFLFPVLILAAVYLVLRLTKKIVAKSGGRNG